MLSRSGLQIVDNFILLTGRDSTPDRRKEEGVLVAEKTPRLSKVQMRFLASGCISAPRLGDSTLYCPTHGRSENIFGGVCDGYFDRRRSCAARFTGSFGALNPNIKWKTL
jgi:hypothetical protein